MTLLEWLDVYTRNGDSQLVCAWRKRAWRAMRPIIEQVVGDMPAWTVSRVLKALDQAAFEHDIKVTGRRWRQEYKKLQEVLDAERALWRAPTDEDRGVVDVATDLVEIGKLEDAITLLREQAPNILERSCRACNSPAGWACHVIGDVDLKSDSPQTAALKAAGIKAWSRQSLIVPHAARVTP